MLRFLLALILFALILIFSIFAIANRTLVVVRFDFWNLPTDLSGALFEVPLYLIVFVAGLLGMGVGMILPLLGFVRKQRLALKRKMNEPIAAPPPREPLPPS